jgi:hypothetical protein
MTNRKQRRAKATKEEQVYKISGLSEETLQDRLNSKEEWKPTSSAQAEEDVTKKAPWTPCRVFNLISWVLIALSMISFIVVMWVPVAWLIITVCTMVAVGVFSLFFTTGKKCSNPLLDSNGTAL